MDEVLRRFALYLKRHFGQSSTAKHYLSDLTIFIDVIGKKAPKDVTSVDIDVFIDHQIAAGLKPATINRRLSSLRTLFEFLASENPACHWPNPVIWRRHRLKTGTHLPRDAQDSDVTRLFAVITDARDQAIYGLMVGAGLRVGEIAALSLDNLEPGPEPGHLAKLRVRGKGNKERIVWLPPSLWDTLQALLTIRPPTDSRYLFLNHHGRPLTISGIQYRFKQHCQAAGVTLTCHQLRHTYARRLVENGLPVDSLAKLLGHSQLQTTQCYIDGADPTVRADFDAAMAHLENTLSRQEHLPVTSKPSPLPQSRAAPQTELMDLLERLTELPPWLQDAAEAFLRHRWPTWRGQSARKLAQCFIGIICRTWNWLATHRQVEGWETFGRADLEAWLQARSQDGVSNVTIRNDLGQWRMLLKFMEAHDCPLDPGLFRVKPPKTGTTLPRYLPEADYRRLETTIMQATHGTSYNDHFDRAWFLTLAHTGQRLSELLDWRLGDLNLPAGYATVRGGKPGRDRVVYLTPPLITALHQYLDQRPDLPDNDHVFVLHGRSPSDRAIQCRLAKYGQQAGVHVSPHMLRHTLATRLINQGMPITSLRKILGHERLSTTQIYAHIYDETLYQQFRDVMSCLEAIAVNDWPRPVPDQPEVVEFDHPAQTNTL